MSFLVSAIKDVNLAIRKGDLALTLGWQDIKQRYRRSKVGPFWLTISMGVMIGALGIVFGGVFNAPLSEFLPFLAIGTIVWAFISTTINDGCMAFVSSEAIIKQLPIPLFTHIMRVIWRNLIILAHNIVIIPIVFLFFLRPVGWASLLAVPGLIVISLALTWIVFLLSIICTRFRDMTQIVASVIQVVFYVTPIIWMPSLVSGRRSFFLLDLNPLYHFVEIVRAPLLGAAPSALNWIVSISITLIGWIVTLVIYGKYRERISYWL